MSSIEKMVDVFSKIPFASEIVGTQCMRTGKCKFVYFSKLTFTSPTVLSRRLLVNFDRLFIERVHVPNFGGCQGRRTGVGVTTVFNSLIL